MGSTAGKSNSRQISQLLLSSFRLFIKGVCAFFIFLIVLFLLTEDFYDYTTCDLPLILQLFPFLTLLFGLIYSFFKPYVSGFIIFFASIIFWFSTIIARNQVWLGWMYLIFPLIGILLIMVNRFEQTQQKRPKKNLRNKRTK